MNIFIDASAFIAIILKNESLHKETLKQYKAYKQKGEKFFASDYILDELFTRCSYSAGEYYAKLAVRTINMAITKRELAKTSL